MMASVTEDNFIPSPSATHSQYNGDVPISPQGDLNQSDSMEKISSIHNNIFYKAFGKPSRYPSSSSSRPSNSNNDEWSATENEDSMEYRPYSGFVHRLMGKFSHGDNTSKTSPNSVATASTLSKRFSSLEDVSIENDMSKRNVSLEEPPSITNIQKQNVITSSNLSHRARSIESLDAPLRKSRPLAVPLRHVERKQEREKPLKSPRDSHVLAPDVDLGRDDIIIIENTPSVPMLQLGTDQSNDLESDTDIPRVHSSRDEILPEELPKPNTVLTVRSIFETAASVSATSSHVHLRRRSDSSDITVEKTQGSSGPETKILNRPPSITSPSPVLSPRVTSNEASASSVFKLDHSSKTVSQRNTSEYLYNPPDDSKTPVSSNKTTATPLPPTSYSRPVSSRSSTPRDEKDSISSSSSTPSSARSDIGLNTTGEPKSQSVLERGSLFDSRHSPSPRSTASVKPTIAQNPPAAVKPIPLSAPASAATSYKKSSPVVPVAPFKKREESEDDGTPVLIYQKPKSSHRKSSETHSQMNGKKVDGEKHLIIPKDAKSFFENDQQNAKLVSQRRYNNFDSTDSKTSENNILKGRDKVELKEGDKGDKKTAGHTSVISVTDEKTVINLTRTATDNNQGTSKIKNNVAPSVPPSRPPRSRNNNNTNGTIESLKSRPAPVPPVEIEKKLADKESMQGSMIYVSSSDNSETDSSTPPETPRTQPPLPHEALPVIPPSPRDPPPFPSKICQPPTREPPVSSLVPSTRENRVIPEVEKNNSKEQPIKGIPSIIANRLNKQTNSPRDISNAVIDNKETPGRHSPDGVAVKLRKMTGSFTANDDDNNENKRDSISNDIEMQIANMRKKMDNSRSRGNSGATQIFDSSQLAQKRKERKAAEAKAAAVATSQGIVPPLDLTGLNDNRSNFGNTRRKEIKPCNIKFIGENALTSRNLLKKQRKVKINIKFKDTISDTFEYPSEESALRLYLEEHPNEPEELDDGVVFLGGGFGGESSDDVEEDEAEVSTPRGGRNKEEEESMKTNPALSSTSTLQSYRGRFQEEFVFGSNRQEPEPVVSKPEPVDDPDSMMLRPAEEETVDTWSTNSSSDLLF